MAEGCLSVPGIRVEVPRKAHLVVEAMDLAGRPLTIEARDLLAIVIQHEMDHLEGRLIADWANEGCKSWRDGETPENRQVLD